MPKLNINVTVNNKDEKINFNTTAIIQDDILKYKEENNTTVIYDYKKNILARENDELRMEYCFNHEEKSIGFIKIKELSKKIELVIKTNKLERKNNNIEVMFQIEDNEFLYKIEEIK